MNECCNHNCNQGRDCPLRNVKMNNEPVAWMSQGGDVSRNKDYFEEMGFKDLIPLYTHPVKELTDEEIANTWDDVRKNATLKSSMKDIQDFARAILRKAQGK